MSSIQIIVGSMLGGTEYVAEACEEVLNELDHNVNIHLQPDFNSIINCTFTNNSEQKKNKKATWIICTSTHGAGEYPDNIKQFISDLSNCDQDLSTVRFLTIGIGDSSYDTFCKAAKDATKLLLSKGCSELTSIKTFDMSENIDPEELAKQWIRTNIDLL